MASTPPLNAKVSREDWLDAARAALATQPIDQLKVQVLAETLGVARTSFYWYFVDRQGFVDALIERWWRNTEAIVERTRRPAATIAAACLGVFECWADANLYDVVLDEAVREWGRRDSQMHEHVRQADEQRLLALAAMFERHGFVAGEALVRARIIYHSQIGLYAVGADETPEQRHLHLPAYVRAMTGTDATAAELAAFERFVGALAEVQPTVTRRPVSGGTLGGRR